MDETVLDRIRRYRLRAAEITQIAESIIDAEARRTLELLAERYERVAQALEESDRETWTAKPLQPD